jgi:hypothetical protein
VKDTRFLTKLFAKQIKGTYNPVHEITSINISIPAMYVGYGLNVW